MGEEHVHLGRDPECLHRGGDHELNRRSSASTDIRERPYNGNTAQRERITGLGELGTRSSGIRGCGVGSAKR